jgi:F0F1-type ATP synthase membrane subunit b/b'
MNMAAINFWHTKPAESVVNECETNIEQGLEIAEAQRRPEQ